MHGQEVRLQVLSVCVTWTHLGPKIRVLLRGVGGLIPGPERWGSGPARPRASRSEVWDSPSPLRGGPRRPRRAPRTRPDPGRRRRGGRAAPAVASPTDAARVSGSWRLSRTGSSARAAARVGPGARAVAPVGPGRRSRRATRVGAVSLTGVPSRRRRGPPRSVGRVGLRRPAPPSPPTSLPPLLWLSLPGLRPGPRGQNRRRQSSVAGAAGAAESRRRRRRLLRAHEPGRRR